MPTREHVSTHILAFTLRAVGALFHTSSLFVFFSLEMVESRQEQHERLHTKSYRNLAKAREEAVRKKNL